MLCFHRPSLSNLLFVLLFLDFCLAIHAINVHACSLLPRFGGHHRTIALAASNVRDRACFTSSKSCVHLDWCGVEFVQNLNKSATRQPKNSGMPRFHSPITMLKRYLLDSALEVLSTSA